MSLNIIIWAKDHPLCLIRRRQLQKKEIKLIDTNPFIKILCNANQQTWVWVLSSCIKASPKLSLSSRDECLRSSHQKNWRTKPRLTLHARLFWTKSLKMPFSYWNPLETQKPGSYSGSPTWILATVLSAQSKNLILYWFKTWRLYHACNLRETKR